MGGEGSWYARRGCDVLMMMMDLSIHGMSWARELIDYTVTVMKQILLLITERERESLTQSLSTPASPTAV